MPSANLVNSPAILPIPRHPSPLSFSVSAQDAPSPPSPRFPQPASMTSKSLTNGNILVTGPSRSPDITPTRGLPPASPSPPSPSRVETLVPTHPQPDSLLCRSTFAALEHSSTTLKRLSKSVLASTTVYLTLLEHLERSEDDLMANLGELGRWLEGGYGLNGAVWEPEGGIRKMRKQRWRKEREEMEVMVEQGLKAVKADIKRNGLAGGEAHAKFEVSERLLDEGNALTWRQQNTAKQFYHQTSQYLSPQPSSLTSTFGPGPPIPSTHALNTSQPSASSSSSQLPAVTSRTPQTGQAVSSDLAQAARLAQFDLERYSHHSTLLYAVPPSSISCLDLLMGLYTWAGGLLSETPGRLQGAGGSERELVTSLTSSSRYQEFTPLHSPARLPSNISSKDSLKSSLFDSQAHLGQMRSDLLYAWAMRNRYTTTLEETASLRQSELDGSALTSPVGQSEWAVTSISSNGIEHRNDRKMHKIHRSVGGRLRDLLSSSGSSTSLTGIAAGDKGSRTTLNGMYGRTGNGTETLPEDDILITSPLPTSPSDDDTTTRTFPFPASAPPPPPNGVSSRPTLPSRHSVHIPREPFLPLPFDSSPDLRSAPARFGGVGGLNGTGDEDDKREEVGRKKEGVLWGAGNWAAVNKAGGRGKWESESPGCL